MLSTPHQDPNPPMKTRCKEEFSRPGIDRLRATAKTKHRSPDALRLASTLGAVVVVRRL